jgi:hypothetical protein
VAACSSAEFLVLLWFLVMAPIIVAAVFRSPMVDYRVVALGATAPLLEAATGGPSLAHTLLGAAGMLAVVMAVTQGRRLVRRRLLGVPIGMLLHLVLDGTWANRDLLWWPVFGSSFGDEQIPEFSRSWVVGLCLEGVAVVAAFWAYRRYGLDNSENRARLVSTGQLNREVLQ